MCIPLPAKKGSARVLLDSYKVYCLKERSDNHVHCCISLHRKPGLVVSTQGLLLIELLLLIFSFIYRKLPVNTTIDIESLVLLIV